MMSSQTGNSNRSRPQKYQNRATFKNNLHDTSKQTKTINSVVVQNVCKRCADIIDWKIKYKKYKSLTVPRKCVQCQQKTVRQSYTVMCCQCSKESGKCVKCCCVIEDNCK